MSRIVKIPLKESVMRVFLSWSGDVSHKVALILHNWLPEVIQQIEPYMASEDIAKGARWGADIAQELEAASFGILCLTKESMNEPWLNFEAGALSKSVNNSNVCPFLFGVEKAEIVEPLRQFQAVSETKDDIKKLIHSLNEKCENRLADPRLNSAFEQWYPNLIDRLGELSDKQPDDVQSGEQTHEEVSKEARMLEELLEMSRSNLYQMNKQRMEFITRFKGIRKELGQVNRDSLDMFETHRKEIPAQLIEETLRMAESYGNWYIGIQLALSLLKEQLPWLYGIGMETLTILNGRHSKHTKISTFEQFREMLAIAQQYPLTIERKTVAMIAQSLEDAMEGFLRKKLA